jgi:hypothetical protein
MAITGGPAHPGANDAVPNSPPGSVQFESEPVANGPIVGLVDTSVDPPSQFSPYVLTPINVTGVQDVPGTDPSHGTSMLETMLEAMPNDPSKILPVDVYGSGESTTTYEVMEGVLAAINAGANPINLSLGGTGPAAPCLGQIDSGRGTERDCFCGGRRQHALGKEMCIPAAYPGVISVTASTQTVNGPITAPRMAAAPRNWPRMRMTLPARGHRARHEFGAMERSDLGSARNLARHRQHDRHHCGFDESGPYFAQSSC